MALSLIRGKYVICKIRSRTAADVIEDGAVVQRDGTILAVGPYAALLALHSWHSRSQTCR